MTTEKWHNRIEDEERQRLKQRIKDILEVYRYLPYLDMFTEKYAEEILKEIEK
jgi:hypothetical protein